MNLILLTCQWFYSFILQDNLMAPSAKILEIASN